MPLPVLTYEAAEPRIKSADLLLCRVKHGIGNKAISVVGRSPYVHAGMAAWLRDETGESRLHIVDVLQWHGGRKRLLADEVADYPGRYDLFTVNTDRFPEFDCDGAVQHMLQYADGQYGWWNVFRVSCRHMPLVRFLLPPMTDDKANGAHLPFCSQAVADADRRGGGVDPVLHLSDRATEPGDLARSWLYRRQFSLA